MTWGPQAIFMFLAMGGPLQIFRKIAVAKLANKRLVAYQRPGADPGGGMWGMHPLNYHFQQCFG